MRSPSPPDPQGRTGVCRNVLDVNLVTAIDSSSSGFHSVHCTYEYEYTPWSASAEEVKMTVQLVNRLNGVPFGSPSALGGVTVSVSVMCRCGRLG